MVAMAKVALVAIGTKEKMVLVAVIGRVAMGAMVAMRAKVAFVGLGELLTHETGPHTCVHTCITTYIHTYDNGG